MLGTITARTADDAALAQAHHLAVDSQPVAAEIAVAGSPTASPTASMTSKGQTVGCRTFDPYRVKDSLVVENGRLKDNLTLLRPLGAVKR